MRAKTVLIGFLVSLMMLSPAHAKKKLWKNRSNTFAMNPNSKRVSTVFIV
ncbi:MAG: hypothetical protein R2877_02330 [Bdellovibrionota bacterium]